MTMIIIVIIVIVIVIRTGNYKQAIPHSTWGNPKVSFAMSSGCM